ncbi:MAG: hypothetical protein RDU30_10015 [Desulfovibrionaceae bacterium]|nr:hypothetical protein [Desulfovibrionaceae bacterium]
MTTAPLDTSPAASDRLGKLPAVLSYLERSGWKIRKTKLYADKKKGLLRVQPDGMVLRADADAYAAANLAPADAAPDADDADTLRMKRELLAEELALKRELNERTRFRNQKERGELLSRDEVDQQLVGAVTVLRASLRQWIYTNVPEMVSMVGGDPKKIDEVVHFFVSASNDFFNSFARRRDFEIEMDDDPEGVDGPGPDDAEDAA